MRNRIRRVVFISFGLGMAVGISQASAGANLVLIVNKATAVINLSKNDLRTIYMGEKEKWPTGQKVLPVALSSEPELKAFLKEVCDMSEADYKKYFIQANFTGKTVILPRMGSSAAAVKALVSSTPGAIGFIPAGDVDNSVGIVRYNGALPTDASYRLTDSH